MDASGDPTGNPKLWEMMHATLLDDAVRVDDRGKAHAQRDSAEMLRNNGDDAPGITLCRWCRVRGGVKRDKRV